jgi:hypothetical protein
LETREKGSLARAIAIAASTFIMGLSSMPSTSHQGIQPRPATGPAPLAAQLGVIAPRAIEWAERMAANAARSGTALSVPLQQIARKSGVRHPESIRLVVVDEIPLPDEPLLKAAALKVGLSQSSAAGMTLGYAVVVRRGYEHDIRLLSHEFRHVAQYETCGGIRAFLSRHLAHLVEFGYEDSPFEVDARAHEVNALPHA